MVELIRMTCDVESERPEKVIPAQFAIISFGISENDQPVIAEIYFRVCFRIIMKPALELHEL
jgi:hypothetical protein